MFMEPFFTVEDQSWRRASQGDDDLGGFLFTDELTGLQNRRSFRYQIEKHRDQADREGSSFALIYIDIDHFRQLNVQFGHSAADSTLVQIANLLGDVLSDGGGLLFRYGGDEFLAILPGTIESHALLVANQFHNTIGSFFKSDETKTITVSIAVAIYPQHAPSLPSMFNLLDRTMHACKQKGGNQVMTATPNPSEQPAKTHARIRCRGLAGRTLEWNRLQEIFFECRTGSGRFVFITGESGIGKTHLLNHFLVGRREGDCVVFSGKSESHSNVVNAVLLEAVKNGIEENTFIRDLISRLPNDQKNVISSFVPSLLTIYSRKTSLRSDFNDDRLLRAIYTLIYAITSVRPMVLSLDGINTHDALVLSLLQTMAREFRGQRLMVIATFQKDIAMSPILNWFVHSTTRAGQFEEVALNPLSPDECSLMVSSIFKGTPVSETFRNWVFDETLGNPFYVEELIQLAVEEGLIEISGGAIHLRKTERILIPDSVRDPILQRIRSLTEIHQNVLGFAAVLGYEFEGQLICSLFSESAEFREEMLHELVHLNFLRNAPGEKIFRFSNQRIRDLIYEEMGRFNRKMCHERVAEFLEQTSQTETKNSQALAYHFARTGNALKAIHYLQEVESKDLCVKKND